MAEPTTTTTRRAAHCSKHAFAPSASFRRRNGISGNVTLPAQRHQTGFCRAELASDSPEAGGDPVNQSDPTGLWTEGYCVQAGGSVAVGAAGVQGCIVESNGNQEVGLTFSGGYGVGISLNGSAWKRFLTSPSEAGAWKALGASGAATGGYEISNAQNITDLAGPFREHAITLGDGWGGTATYFTGNSPDGEVTGIYLGVGVVGGASFTDQKTWTKVRVLSGTAATAVAGIITGLNIQPAEFLIRSSLREMISAIAGGSSGSVFGLDGYTTSGCST